MVLTNKMTVGTSDESPSLIEPVQCFFKSRNTWIGNLSGSLVRV